MSEIHSTDIDLNLLVLFHTVFSERSASKAGERLGLTQSAVSHSLKKLRHLFQDDLFVRAGGMLLPTPRAEELHEAVRDVIETVERKILPVASFVPSTARREFVTAMSD